MADARLARRTVFWQRMDSTGLEYCDLEQTERGWQFAGVALAVLDGAPTQVQYQVECDATWHTREVSVTQARGSARRSVTLTRDDDNNWYEGWRPIPEIAGRRDIDLGISPATNTLPIRRLGLAVGESRSVIAAWMRFPELTLAPLAQRYTRLTESRYRYESPGFTTEIVVDDWGLVISYIGGWERVPQ